MTVREIALKLLLEYEASGKYVNLSLSSHIADSLTREERSLLTVLLYTTVERKLTYDYYIASISGRGLDKIKPHTLGILRLGMCQLTAMSSIPPHAAVNETVKLARDVGERSFVNGILRRAAALAAEGALPLPDGHKSKARYLSVKESFPLSTVKRLVSLFGLEATERLLEFFNNDRHTDLTVNLQRLSRGELIARLSEDGIEAAPSPLNSLTVRIPTSLDPRALRGFSEGDFLVQDAASASAAEVAGAKEGETVLDVCSAPGGKSFASAILSRDRARIISSDIHDSKLSLIESGRDRLGLSSIEVRAGDATVTDPELIGECDLVICDVPCSGLGVLGKKPDLRYKSVEVDQLTALQYSILKTSAKYPRLGGRLLYSTCTLDPRENEEQLARFLSEHEDFAPCDFTLGEYSSKDGALTLLPHIHGTDGFFISLIKRVK